MIPDQERPPEDQAEQETAGAEDETTSPDDNEVEEASKDSFPASDPPAW